MTGGHMFESLFTTLGTMVANKKIVGAWLVLLSFATVQIGESVYISGAVERSVLAVERAEVKKDLSSIQQTLDRIEKKQIEQGLKLDGLVIESNRVRVELDLGRPDSKQDHGKK
jgi:hypothetical protein